MRTKIWPIRIGAALPPRNEAAKLAARALVLRADMLIEEPGIYSDTGFAELERVGEVYRRMYFTRGLLKTLSDVIGLGDAVLTCAEFTDLFAFCPRERREFEENLEGLRPNTATIREARNAIGAHVQRQVGDSLDTMPEDYGVMMEFHEDDGVRPRVAEWLLLVALFPGVPEAELEPRFRELQRILMAAADFAPNARRSPGRVLVSVSLVSSIERRPNHSTGGRLVIEQEASARARMDLWTFSSGPNAESVPKIH